MKKTRCYTSACTSKVAVVSVIADRSLTKCWMEIRDPGELPNLWQWFVWLKATALRLSWYRQTKCCHVLSVQHVSFHQEHWLQFAVKSCWLRHHDFPWNRRKDIRYHQLWVMRCFPCSWPSPVTASFSTRCSLLKPWPHYSACTAPLAFQGCMLQVIHTLYIYIYQIISVYLEHSAGNEHRFKMFRLSVSTQTPVDAMPKNGGGENEKDIKEKIESSCLWVSGLCCHAFLWVQHVSAFGLGRLWGRRHCWRMAQKIAGQKISSRALLISPEVCVACWFILSIMQNINTNII